MDSQSHIHPSWLLLLFSRLSSGSTALSSTAAATAGGLFVQQMVDTARVIVIVIRGLRDARPAGLLTAVACVSLEVVRALLADHGRDIARVQRWGDRGRRWRSRVGSHPCSGSRLHPFPGFLLSCKDALSRQGLHSVRIESLDQADSSIGCQAASQQLPLWNQLLWRYES